MKPLLCTVCFFILLPVYNLSAQNKFVSGNETETIPAHQSLMKALICDTIFSFPAVDTWPTGLISDGNYLWSFGNDLDYIYKYSFSGTVIDSILNPASPYTPDTGGDLDFDGTNLLLLSEETDTLYQINPNTGAVVSRYRVSPCSGNCHGVAFDGTYIWICDYLPAYIYKLNAASGALLNTLPISAPSFMLPIKFINGKLYGLSIFPGMLHQIDTASGNFISTVPWCLGYSLGFCVANNHLWGLSSAISTGGTQRIYQFDSLLLSTDHSDFAEHNSFDIFPNPSTGNITVSFPVIINNGSVEISNILGKTIYKEGVYKRSKKEITLNDISPGIYFVKANNGEQRYCRKLIIEKKITHY